MASASGRSEGKKKGDCVLLCELSSLQSTLYTVLTEMETFRLVSGSQEPCTCDSGEPQGYCCRVSNKKGQPWFELVAYCTVLLLKCANHVGLLLSSRDCDDQVQRCLQKTFRRHSELLGLSSAASFLTLSSTQYCGKLKVLEKLLPRLKIKARKIVFYTHSHQMVVALEEFFMSLKYSYIKMDSTVSLLSRQKMVERFREQTTTEFILLCSTESNECQVLTSGDLPALVYDPCFNSSGSQRCPWCSIDSVAVYKLVSLGTIEEMLYLRSAAGCHGTPSRRGAESLFSYADLFTLHPNPVSMGKDHWQITTKTVEGVCISQLSSSRGASTDSGIGGQPFHIHTTSQPSSVLLSSCHPSGLLPSHQPSGLLPSHQPSGLLPSHQPSGLLPSSCAMNDNEAVLGTKFMKSLNKETSTLQNFSDDDATDLTRDEFPSKNIRKARSENVRKTPISAAYKRKKKLRKGLVYESENEDIGPSNKRAKQAVSSNSSCDPSHFLSSGELPITGMHKNQSPLSFKPVDSTSGHAPEEQGYSLSYQPEPSLMSTGSHDNSHIGESPELFPSTPTPDPTPINMDELFGI